MYLPNLLPRDAHHVWVSQSNIKHSTNAQGSSSELVTTQFPPLSSYSPAYPGTITTPNHNSSFLSSPSDQANNSTLEYLRANLTNDLQYLNRLGKFGYNYLKPIGVDKCMRQMLDEQETADDPINFEGGDAMGDFDDEEDGDNAVGNSVEELTHSLHLHNDHELDLDVQIPDNDINGLDFTANEDDDLDEQLNNPMSSAEEFMASEEYQNDHSILLDPHGTQQPTSSLPAANQDEVLANSGPLTSATLTTQTSASTMIRGISVGDIGEHTATGDTSPQTPYYPSHSNLRLQDSPCLRSSELRNVNDVIDESSDYEMTLE